MTRCSFFSRTAISTAKHFKANYFLGQIFLRVGAPWGRWRLCLLLEQQLGQDCAWRGSMWRGRWQEGWGQRERFILLPTPDWPYTIVWETGKQRRRHLVQRVLLFSTESRKEGLAFSCKRTTWIRKRMCHSFWPALQRDWRLCVTCGYTSPSVTH